MKITVLHFYQNRTLQIPAGDYEASDPRLSGLADYLIANGHAVASADEKSEPKKVTK